MSIYVHNISAKDNLSFNSQCNIIYNVTKVHTEVTIFLLFGLIVHKMEEFANANIVVCNRLRYETHTFQWNPWKFLSYFEFLHQLYLLAFSKVWMFLDAWKVHTKKINNNIKSIQEGFQKFYMEGKKSERSYTWNMIYVTSQIVYSIQV